LQQSASQLILRIFILGVCTLLFLKIKDHFFSRFAAVSQPIDIEDFYLGCVYFIVFKTDQRSFFFALCSSQPAN
jgi:hypothetical protein